MRLSAVRDSRTLSKEAVYQIDGCLYRYLYTDGTDKHLKHHFEPLPAQRKTAKITLNRQTLLIRCQIVEGKIAPPQTTSQWKQLSLF